MKRWQKHSLIGLVFFAWLVGLSATYWYLFLEPKGWFDSSLDMPHALHDDAEQRQLRSLLLAQFPNLPKQTVWFIRIKQMGCRCEQYVDLYHQSYEKLSTHAVLTLDMDSTELSMPLRRFLHRVVTATPAAFVFNPDGTLAYFGPYHQEGVCSAENSYIDPVLQHLAQGRNVPTVVNNLVYGCFCASTPFISEPGN